MNYFNYRNAFWDCFELNDFDLISYMQLTTGSRARGSSQDSGMGSDAVTKSKPEHKMATGGSARSFSLDSGMDSFEEDIYVIETFLPPPLPPKKKSKLLTYWAIILY